MAAESFDHDASKLAVGKRERIPALPKGAFLVLAVLCLAPLFPLPREIASLAAPAALLAGAGLGVTMGNPYAERTKRPTRWLLQGSVALLGFSMDLHKVAETGRSGLLFSLFSIASVFGLGWVLRRALGIRPVTGLLVSAGTAICGGSAIAAIGTAVDAPEEDVSVAMGTVFVLNALALLLFPPLGHALGLTQRQFGVWSGLAIHDIASVVGAGTAYGREALDVATTTKLSRVLYLLPIALVASATRRRGGSTGKTPVPWFVGFFLLASTGRELVPMVAAHTEEMKRIAAAGFSLSLFLIGATLSRRTLKAVGPRPLAMGAALWAFVSVVSLAAAKLG